MERYLFFFNYAVNGLRRGGQRVLIAMLAVAFGVMSLITMASIAESIERTMVKDALITVGGDLRISRATDEMFARDDIAGLLGSLQSDGLITGYSPVSESFNFLLRTENNGKAQFIQRGIGVDPSSYPAAGELVIGQPENATLAELLSEPGSTVITRDVAKQYDLHIGDTLRLAEPDGAMMGIPLHVTGIIDDTPTHGGRRMYYSLETTETLYGETAVFDYVVVQTGEPEAAAAQLESHGWQVQRAYLQVIVPSEQEDFFIFMVRGAGILGLLVGGIGIANTMQVLLAQRRQEVGILKTLGYAQSDMIFIFVLEAVILGTVGSVIGAVTAILISQGMTEMFSNISTLLIGWQFNFALAFSGILTGIVTTVIFAMYAIVRTSGIRPTVIFRREMVEGSDWRQVLKALGFYAVLAIPFAGVTSLILGSVERGIGILLFALGGLVVLGIGLGGLTWLILRFFPTFNFNLLRMARNNMRKRAFSMIFAMIALFVGIFTLGFAATVIQVSMDQFALRYDTTETYNLLVYTDSETAPEVENLLTDSGVGTIERRYMADTSEVNSYAEGLFDDGLQIRDRAWDIEIVEGAEFGSEQGAYVFAAVQVAVGDEITLRMSNGTVHTLPVIGRYVTNSGLVVQGVQSVVISRETLNSLGDIPLGQVNVYASVEPSRLAAVADLLGRELPNIMTLTSADVLAEMNGVFLNLFGFALSMSGLALMAGVMLIANVVSLAMMERRYEIGVMKAVGYTQRHVLATLSMEYGLIGVIASIVGLIGVQVAITGIVMSQSGAQDLLTMQPATAVIVFCFGVVLTLITALLAAMGPARTRPLAVLNERAL